MLNGDDGEELKLSGGPEDPAVRTSSQGAKGPDARPVKGRLFPSPLAPPLIQIATTHSDDPWAGGLDDRLGVADEAKSFARMAVSKDFTPPLAIGLFGDWGSGKSFFMRLVHEHIERLTSGDTERAPEVGMAGFHTDVVQIRFNAWHYAETNLWASLVAHLFTELDRWYGENNPDSPESLLETLVTARSLTLEAARELVARRSDQRNATKELLAATDELNAARDALGGSPGVYWRALKSVLLDSEAAEENREALKTAAREIGLTDLADEVEGFQRVSASLASESARARLLSSGLMFQLQRRSSVLLVIVSVLLAPVVASWIQVLLSHWPSVFGGLQQTILSVSLGVAAVTNVVARCLAKTRNILGRLETAKASIDKAVEQSLVTQADDLQRQQEHLAQTSAKLEEAQALVKTTSERLAEASHNYTQGTGASRLKKFVRARAVDGDYARHLGLIATVRKDFEELSACISGDRVLSETVEHEREVFAKRMRHFLQTHEQLLSPEEMAALERSLIQGGGDKKDAGPADPKSFKRIVLYIDDLDRCPPEKVVDVLQAVHLLLTFPIFVVMVAVDVRWVRKALLKHYSGLIEENGDANLYMASANDYLEKVFQIPYWMRPMDDNFSTAFLVDRLHRLDSLSAPRPGGSHSRKVEVSPLSIDAAEEQLLKELAPCIGGSPRRTLRFLNTYRLIKASLGARELSVLRTRGYKALLVQLALATAAPKLFEKTVKRLSSVREDSHLNDLIAGLIDDDDESPQAQRAARIFSIYQRVIYDADSDKPSIFSVTMLQDYAAIAQRYSFAG
ncbi:P-loop NTPase fold protein [Pseudomonas gingeri]